MGGDCLKFRLCPVQSPDCQRQGRSCAGSCLGYGVANVVPQVDYAAANDHIHDVIARIQPMDSQKRFEGFGVKVIREYGSFVSPTQVQAKDHLITARRVVVATGSSPLVPPLPGLDQVPYFTNETIFDLRDKPEHLLIIGGGPIGMEMAQAHTRLGCKVTVIEGMKALGKDDPEAASVVLDSLRAEGVAIEEDALVTEVTGQAGAIEVKTKDGRSVKGTHLLVAVGRKSNTEKLGLEAAGIKTEGNGIAVDASLRTTNRKVYAIGDVAGGLQFTHVAGLPRRCRIIRSMPCSACGQKPKRPISPGRPIPTLNCRRWG